MSAGGDRDRLGGRSNAQAEGRRGEAGPRGRFPDEDRGENPAAHFPDADPDVARRLAGADTGSPRERGPEPDPGRGAVEPQGRGTDGPARPPIYECATSASASAGSPATGSTASRSGSAPGVSSTTNGGRDRDRPAPGATEPPGGRGRSE